MSLPEDSVITASEPLDDERLHDLLVKSSRTFALAIPLLPQPTLREVTIAYLLFRIADTFEDASVLWSESRRREALADFCSLLDSPSEERAARLTREWLREPPTDHAGYLELLGETPGVLASWRELSPDARRILADHTRRTSELMASFVERSDERGVLRLEDLAALRKYCYAVAGIVGEMLTELFLLERSHLAPIAPYLRARAADFGEGLQLVNILKDSADDATEGRNFLPAGLDRAGLFELARADLDAACEYTLAIQEAGGPNEIVAFTAVPVELAWATLDTVEKKGPGSKITRVRVFALYNRVLAALKAGRPVLSPRAAR